MIFKKKRKAPLDHKSKYKDLVALPNIEETKKSIARIRKAFRQKFGRNPLPDDPIFFDPAKPELVFMTASQFREARESVKVAEDKAILLDFFDYAHSRGLMINANMEQILRENGDDPAELRKLAKQLKK